MKRFFKFIPILLLLCGLCGFSTIYADQTYTFYRVNTSCIIDSSGNRVSANDVIQKDATYSLQTRTILEWGNFSDSLSGCVGKWNYAEKVNLTLKDADEVYLAGYGSDWYNSAIPKKDGYEFKGWIDSKGNNIGNTFHIYNTDTTTSYEYTASWEAIWTKLSSAYYTEKTIESNKVGEISEEFIFPNGEEIRNGKVKVCLTSIGYEISGSLDLFFSDGTSVPFTGAYYYNGRGNKKSELQVGAKVGVCYDLDISEKYKDKAISYYKLNMTIHSESGSDMQSAWVSARFTDYEYRTKT